MKCASFIESDMPAGCYGAVSLSERLRTFDQASFQRHVWMTIPGESGGEISEITLL